MPLRNPLSALLDYASARGNEASSIGSVMSQLARPILVSQGVQTEGAAPAAPMQGGGVPAAPLPKTTSDAEEYYIREFQRRGMSRPASEGIVAGMGSESGLNPTINERNPVVPGSRGGFGLYQLTGPRRIAFERWASENGKNVNDDQAQIDFMMTEFAGPERKAYDALIQAPDAQSAATIFTDAFLRPGVSHAPQSANSAARMSGQPYDPAMAGAGAMAATGGALPQTVEGILSSLYPDSTEAEKAAHRKDIWRGLSQGLSALSQGGQVDLSNIAANADQRRRQYVLDTREKEKAKAAASLVYSQTGDANMAAGIASGAINYSDVLNERQMKRAEQAAQDARLKDAAATDALVTAMKVGKMPQETIDLVQKGGVEALNSYQKLQADQHLLEQEAKQKDIKAQNVADAQYILSTAAPGSPEARTAERVVALGGEEDYYTLLKARTPDAASVPDQMIIAKQMVDDGLFKTVGDALASLNAKSGAGPAPNVVVRPDGTISITPATPTAAPAATTTTAPAPTTGVGEAFAAEFGPTPAGTVTTTNAQGEIVNAPIPGATAPQQALTDLAVAKQKLQQTIAQEQDVNKKVAAEATLAELNVQEAQLKLDNLRAATPTDAEKAKVDLANAEAALAGAKLDNEKKARELDDAETGKAASLAASLARADAGASATTSTVSKILKATEAWEAGMLGGGQRALATMIPGSDTYNVAEVLIPQLNANSIIANIQAMKAASPNGSTGFGATTAPELSALTDILGKLDVKGDPALLRENVRTLNNYVLDSAYGTVEQIKANDKLTDAEKEFYGQRYDTQTGEIKYLGLKPIDEGVITMWDKPAPELDPNALTPQELELFKSVTAPTEGGN